MCSLMGEAIVLEGGVEVLLGGICVSFILCQLAFASLSANAIHHTAVHHIRLQCWLLGVYLHVY